MAQLNVFEKNPDIGKPILEKMLAGKMSSRKAAKRFAKHGIEVSDSNLRGIVKRMKENFETSSLLIVDSPLTSHDARIRVEAIRKKLAESQDGEIIKVDFEKLIAGSIADLELLKQSWGYDHRYYLHAVKLQTDIAIARLKSPLTQQRSMLIRSYSNLTG